MTYRGRFAPTPSGPLHLGSLLTALAGYLQAKSQNGQWLLRMDDLDRPRCVPGADTEIQRQLATHALQWDGSVRYQSAHEPEYRAALEKLHADDVLYACICTRAELARDSRPGADGPVYSGTCRGKSAANGPHALRLELKSAAVQIDDGWQGALKRQTSNDIGDFIVRRADGQIGYQLACVVDEIAMGITEVVRGADLIGSSFRQIALMAQLKLEAPRYRHLPVLLDDQGRKLSKQNHAKPAQAETASANLATCLQILGQHPPAAIRQSTPAEVVTWAVSHWQPAQVPQQLAHRINGAAQQVLA